MSRPDCFDFSMDFLGGEDAEQVRAYVERLEAQQYALLAAAKATVEAHGSLFEQCCSNPITNAWGKEVNVAALNDAARLAGDAIRAVEQQCNPAA